MRSTYRSIRRTRRGSVNGGSRGSTSKQRVAKNLARARFLRIQKRQKKRSPGTSPPRCASGSSRGRITNASFAVLTGRGVARERGSRSSTSVPLRYFVVMMRNTSKYYVIDTIVSKRSRSTGRNSFKTRLAKKGIRERRATYDVRVRVRPALMEALMYATNVAACDERFVRSLNRGLEARHPCRGTFGR